MTEPRPLTVLRRAVPDTVDTAVQRALEKLPADRWTSAAQFAEALQGKTVAAGRQKSGRPLWSARWHWTSMLPLGASFAIAAVGIAAWLAPRSVVPAPPMRFEVTVPPRAPIFGIAVAQSVIVPDGTALIVRGQGTKSAILYRRPLDQTGFIPIAGSEGARGFAVSPDGDWIAFAADSQLKKVPIQGGAPTTIVNLVGTPPAGLSWGHDAIVLGASGAMIPALTVVPVSEGNRRAISFPDTARGRNHRWPRVLADGETVLFVEFPREGLDSARIGITSLATGSTTVLNLLGAYPLGVMDGHLVYVRADGTIMAVPIDLKHRRIRGEPIAIEQGVSVRLQDGGTQADLSPSGMLAFAAGDDARRRQEAGVHQWTISEDRAVGVRHRSAHADPVGRGNRLLESSSGVDARWKAYAFSSSRAGPIDALWWQVADGSAAAEPLASSSESLNEVAFSPDGNTIVFRQGGGPHKLAYRAMGGDTTITSLVASPYVMYHPTISPDGKWLAYTSHETGEPRVYVRAFPGPASKWPCPTAPRSSRDGLPTGGVCITARVERWSLRTLPRHPRLP